MNKKGFFALLTAAMAGAWETVVTQLMATFRYRVAGGADNDDLPESNGRAVINAIHGNTVKWNQLVDDPSLMNTRNWNHTSSTIEQIEGGGFRITKTSNTSGGTLYKRDIIPPVGHKCIVIIDITEMNITGSSPKVYFGFSDNRYFTTKGYVAETIGKYGGIYTINESYESFGTRVGMGGTDIDSNATIKSINLFDLTEMGIDDIINSYDDFEAWLALNVGEQDYYPYDEGSLISFKGTGIKSVGFNQWDEQFYTNKYWSDSFVLTNQSGNCCFLNPVKCIKGATYFFKKATAIINYTAKVFSKDGVLLEKKNIANSATDRTVTITEDNCVLVVNFNNNPSNKDICINISDAAKNGTYEPYWSDEKPFDVTKVYGKLRGEGSLVQVFPDGMFGVLGDRLPDDYIEYSDGYMEAVAANKKIDLGDCAWSLVSGCSHTFETTIDITKVEAIGYTFSDEIDESDTTQDKLIGLVDGGSTKLALLDRSLSSTDLVSGHITALEGVDAVYYHPNIDYYLNLVYRDNGTDTPLEEIFPIKYKVDKYSTEELLVPASEAGEPTSTAIIADIDYQITGHNYIDDLFVDMGLPSGTLWAKCDIDITKPNGFCETPFTYEKSFFSWGNIDGHNPTSTLSFSPYDWGSSIDGEPYTSSKGNTLQANISTSKEYDAAMANLGQLFKMPTSTQFKELVDNCDFVQADGTTVIDDSVTDKRVTVNSIVGIYLKSKINGNLIFFSASGNGNGSSWNSRGVNGFYWSASFNSSRNAQILNFYSGGVNPQNNYFRYLGFAIRPIKNQ